MRKFKALFAAVALAMVMTSSSFALDTNSVAVNNNNSVSFRQVQNEQVAVGRVIHGIGLSLEAGQAGSSLFKFFISSVPSNARITNVKINPGSLIVRNGNNKNMMGAVVMEEVELTSPSGAKETVAWNPRGMDLRGNLLNTNPKGEWIGVVRGRNLARATGNPMMDLRFFGSTIYKLAEVEVTYVTE